MKVINWILSNRVELMSIIASVVLILEVIVNLTPSKKDNSILLKLKNWLSFIIPNKTKDGGEFVTESRPTRRMRKKNEEN